MKTSNAKPKTYDDYLGNKPLGIYKMTPQKIYKLTEGVRIKGYYVDKKIEIKLP